VRRYHNKLRRQTTSAAILASPATRISNTDMRIALMGRPPTRGRPLRREAARGNVQVVT
jgi:hypothetical protein